MDIITLALAKNSAKNYTDNKLDAITTNMEYKGSVASQSALPSGASTGDVYTTSDTGERYVWNGTAWQKISEPIDVQTERAMAEVQAKGDEVIASIPSDYTELSGDVADLKNTTSEISESNGNLYYTGRTGSEIMNGVTVTYNSDGSVSLSGTATSTFGIPIMGQNATTDANISAGTYIRRGYGTVTSGLSVRYGNSVSWANDSAQTFNENTNVYLRVASGTSYSDQWYALGIYQTDDASIIPTSYTPRKFTAVDEVARSTTNQIEKSLSYPKLCMFAHRGDHSNCAPNTLTAFASAFNNDFNGVEIDARISSDAVLLVHHDTTATDINGVEHTLSNMTLSEIQNTIFVSGNYQYKIPTMTNALGFIRMTGMKVVLDLKPTSANVSALCAEAVINAGMDKQVIYNIGGSETRASGLLRHATEGQINILTHYLSSATVDTYKKYTAYGEVHFSVTYSDLQNSVITAEEINALIAEGFFIHLVAENTSELNAMLSLNPQYIETEINGITPKTALINYAQTVS